jgi:hypothetical protein
LTSSDDLNLTEVYEQGAAIMADTVAHLKRYVQFQSDAHPTVIAAWLIHTHAMLAAHSTPYIYITSNKMRAGKSTLAEVCEQLAHSCERAAGITPAALLYLMNEGNHTIIIDEIDTVYGPGRTNEDLRRALNGGYRRGATIVQADRKEGIRRIKTFGPKMFAGIDTGIPATVRDRSITITLTRRNDDGDPVERFKPFIVKERADELANRIHDWARKCEEYLKHATPAPVFGLDDRADEIAEPLVAIYDLCGAEWATTGRSAIAELLADRDSQDEHVVMLNMIKAAFDGEDQITTADLLDILREWKPGLTSRELARRCKGFDAEPTTLNMGGDVRAKGYRLMDFSGAFAKYLD